MANMEFLKASTLLTTGSFKVDSSTDLVQFIFDRNLDKKYSTSGYSSDTSTVISYEFDNATVISSILLQNHNFKQFRAFYNSATANTFSVDVNVSSNSETSSYFSFDSITVNSIQIQVDSPQTDDNEKSVGEIVVSERRVQFERNPSTENFDPKTRGTRITHRMPDGGITQFNVATKFMVSMSWKFVTTSFKNTLETIYDDALPLYFLPFPTTTAWDGIAHEVLWSNQFDFKHGDNAKTQGFNGSIRLEETSNA